MPTFDTKTQNMVLEIPDSMVDEMPLSVEDLRIEFAVWLYHQKRLSLGQARKLAGMGVIGFQKLLAEHGLFLNYEQSDLDTDLQSARLLA